MAFGGLLILSNRSPVMPRLLPDFPIKNLLAVNFFVTATVEVSERGVRFFSSKSLPFQMPVANSFLPYPLSKKGGKTLLTKNEPLGAIVALQLPLRRKITATTYITDEEE